MYILVQKFESKHVIASNIEFEKNVKEYEFFLGGEITGIKLLSTGVLVIDIENEDTDLRVGDIIQLKFLEDRFSHSLIIVDKKGNALEDIYIATHTQDAYYRKLSTYNFNDIRFLHIIDIRI